MDVDTGVLRRVGDRAVGARDGDLQAQRVVEGITGQLQSGVPRPPLHRVLVEGVVEYLDLEPNGVARRFTLPVQAEFDPFARQAGPGVRRADHDRRDRGYQDVAVRPHRPPHVSYPSASKGTTVTR